MRAIEGDRLRGHLEGLILAALEGGAGHGWEIWSRLEESAAGLLRLKEGSLYPALYRLERERLIVGRWESDASGRRGPRRRVYRLTPKGRRQLVAARGEWRQFVNVIGGLLGAT